MEASAGVHVHDFEEGDVVVVVGDSIDNNGHVDRRLLLADVLAVGKEELYLSSRKDDIVFKRNRRQCYKVELRKPNSKIVQPPPPKLGDLVLSYTGSRYTEKKRLVGILIEIVDNPPSSLRARILQGEKTEAVPFSSLIVLEEK